jgi:hypothetical protein
MTEPERATPPERADDDTPEGSEARGQDWFLEQFVERLNTDPAAPRIWVTLAVRGTIVTGQIISAREWLEETAGGTGTADAVLSNAEEREPSRGAPPGAARRVPRHIHLREARYISDGIAIPEHRGMPWRGRLDAVDGFSFGSLLPSSQPSEFDAER